MADLLFDVEAIIATIPLNRRRRIMRLGNDCRMDYSA
ncbi:hypothetical protein LSPH24S_04209 [Lysinibacillus sphaericus]